MTARAWVPMLAVAGAEHDVERLTSLGGWVFQPKLDGVRAIAVHGRLITRGGVDVTDRFPEIPVGKLRDLVLDGELVADDPDPHGFERVSRRAAGGPGAAAVFRVFDVLEREQIDVRRLTLRDRSTLLLGLGLLTRTDYAVQPLGHTADGVGLWRNVVDEGGEGVVAKRLTSQYHGGRRRDWVKVKHTQTITCAVIGHTPGRGRRRDVGALTLALITSDGGIFRVGEVGSGFTEADLDEVVSRLATGEPFAVEVRHMGWTSGRKLRHPVFVRFRDDIPPTEARADQVLALIA